MGSYVDQAGYEARFGAAELTQLADRDDDGAPDSDVLDAAIRDTEAEANSYLGQRYPLPLPEATDAVKRAAYDVLRYRLHGDSVPEEIRTRYDDAIKWLKAVARGEAGAGIAEQGADETAGTEIAVAGPDSVYTSEWQDRYRGHLPRR